jgi:hypothetical protein
MSERLILKGYLSDLKLKRMQLETRISANVKAAKALLAGSSITPIAKIDIEGAAVNLSEAAILKNELTDVLAKIAIAEEELA